MWKLIYTNTQIINIATVASIIGHEIGVGIYNPYASQLFRLSDTRFSSYGDRIFVVFLN